jgi:pimeloyl-ACP methyl ester carboxylesterase
MANHPLALAAGLLLAASCATPAQQPAPAEKRTAHAEINGIRLYYEIHNPQAGGTPLVLLHGGGSSIEVSWGKTLPFFAAVRTVIGIDEQNHGRSTGRPGPLTFESSADDVAALLKSLKIEKADLMGFSNGATVALQVAIRHPEVVRKLVHVSSFTRKKGAQPQFWQFMSKADFSNMPQALKDIFLSINPDPARLRSMHDKDLARMLSWKDVPDSLVRRVKAPTLVVSGDRDVLTPEHAVEISRLIPGARLLILPGNHGDFLGEPVMSQPGQTDVMPILTAGLINEFLGKK